MLEFRWIAVEKHRPGALLAIGPYGGEHWQVLQWRFLIKGKEFHGPRGWEHVWSDWEDVEFFPDEGEEEQPRLGPSLGLIG